jgi:ABC-type multidrug transport system fused ATPase/permease subunit
VDIWEIQKKSYALLDQNGKRKYLLALGIQISLGLFDIIGVMLAGVVAVLASSSLTGAPMPPALSDMFSLVGLSNQNPGNLILFLSLMTLLFFALKTLLALYYSRRSFKFLAHQQSKVTSMLVSRVFKSDYIWLRNQEPHKISTAIILGVSAATTNSLGQFILLISEVALVILFISVLTIFNPTVALLTLIYLISVILIMRQFVGSKVSRFNQDLGISQVNSEIFISSALKLFREIRIFRRGAWFENELEKLSEKRAQSFANDMWVQQVPKYVLEISMLMGAAGLLAAGKALSTSDHVIPILAVYLAAAGRVLPSLLRIQSAIFSLQSRQHYASLAHELLRDVNSMSAGIQLSISTFHAAETKGISISESHAKDTKQSVENAIIDLNEVSFRFPNSETDALNGLTLQIRPGEKVAIVGPSGAGKSTLCDLFLGLLIPTSGKALIGNSFASNWVEQNPGKVSYLPQEITITKGTLLENVCLGIERTEIDWEAFTRAVDKAQLQEVIEQLDEGIETNLGIEGVSLSGGQKQRIGLARALYSTPSILVMDEATSALDMETEFEVMKSLEDLGPDTTLIVIAHRLSSIRKFHRIIYLENGLVCGDGDLKQVRESISQFDNQLRLSGI